MLSDKENIIYWVWLTSLPHIGNATARRLWEAFGDINGIYMAQEKELSKIKGLQQRQKDVLGAWKDLEKARDIIRKCQQSGIGVLTIDDSEYPVRCRYAADISPVLYYKGKNAMNGSKTVGIIGKRRCTEQGKSTAIHLAEKKCKEGYAIVSGFANGIDSYAHTAAIKENGYTIGVLGNGIDVCYPPEQIMLKQIMEKQGMLISQYPPGTFPRKYTFPARNKMIAALSDELYVIEKVGISGTQSTIDAAEKYGKKICYCSAN